MSNPIIIAPSLLSADFSKLGQEMCDVIEAGADWIHLDIMDGHFVPNISFGADIVRKLRPLTTIPFDVHLMIENYTHYIPDFCDAGADFITIHAEAGPHLHRGLQLIKAHQRKAGVALNPATPIHHLESLLNDLDLILIMSVNPGFGGQKLVPQTVEKVKQVKNLIGDRPIHLQVDGGINEETIASMATAGADVFVAGSAIYQGKNQKEYQQKIMALRQAATQT